MSQAELFKRLGAPLRNVRWSWGAVSLGGVVFLRVWQDQDRKIDSVWTMQVTYKTLAQHSDMKLGYEERLMHVDLIRAGAPSYMVMCEAKDVSAIPRQVKRFNRNEVFEGGMLLEADGMFWLERKGRVPVERFSEGVLGAN